MCETRKYTLALHFGNIVVIITTSIIHLKFHNTECVLWKECIQLHSMEICMNGLCNKFFAFMFLFPVKGIRFSLYQAFIIFLGICGTVKLN